MAVDEEVVQPEQTSEIPLSSKPLDPSFLLVPCRKLMHTQLGTVSADTTVFAAAKLMAENGYGCVLVVTGTTLDGIFTERDLMNKIVATGMDPAACTVGDYMTHDPETLRPDDEVAYALRAMMLGGFRHVPVVDTDRRLVGIFSARDLKRLVLEHFEREISTLPPTPHYQEADSRHGA